MSAFNLVTASKSFLNLKSLLNSFITAGPLDLNCGKNSNF